METTSNAGGAGAKCVYVLSDIDGFKYKLVMEGDLGLLTTEKIKRYMQNATGLAREQQQLLFNGHAVPESASGADLGLYDGAMLRLCHVHTTRHALGSRPPSAKAVDDTAARLAALERRLATAQHAERAAQAAMEDMRAAWKRATTESEAAALKWRAKEEELVRELDRLRAERRGDRTPEAAAERQLHALSHAIGLAPIRLDENDTCVVPIAGGLSLLLTLEATTARLFVYATLASGLPPSPEVRLRLYETLLEGALLGRDMAGGGVGISKADGLVIMSTSIDLAHADDEALAEVARPFMAAVQRWTETALAITEKGSGVV